MGADEGHKVSRRKETLQLPGVKGDWRELDRKGQVVRERDDDSEWTDTPSNGHLIRVKGSNACLIQSRNSTQETCGKECPIVH